MSSCAISPYFAGANGNPAPVLASAELLEQDYSSTNSLLAQHVWNYSQGDLNCHPQGVSPSTLNGSPVGPSQGYPGGQLISTLDENNPVAVCDPRAHEEIAYQVDGRSGIGDPNVVSKTVDYSYDSDNQGVPGYDYGNLNETSTTGNDVPSNFFILNHAQMYPNDNFNNGNGTYLTGLPAYTSIRTGGHTSYLCDQTIYGSNTQPNAAPRVPDVSAFQQHILADDNGHQGCSNNNPSNLVSVGHTYDASGNAITATDGDNHLGCNNNNKQYSACATYDGLATHLLTATNALNQVTTSAYDSGAAGGFGQWLTASTDRNSQTTSYQYDVMGRLVGIVRPGDALGVQPSPIATSTVVATAVPLPAWNWTRLPASPLEVRRRR